LGQRYKLPYRYKRETVDAIPVGVGVPTVTQTNLAGFSNFSDVRGQMIVVSTTMFGGASITGRNFVDIG
jgi:hypothetical protein